MSSVLPTNMMFGAILATYSLVGFRTVTAQEATPGQALFEGRCVACHSTGTDRIVGPGLQGVTERRERSWLLDFITNPDGMISRGDSIASGLLAKYEVPMPNFGLSRDQAESILAYLSGEAPTAVSATTTLPPGDPGSGGEIFIGKRRLENGGPACLSCHDISGVAALGGGTLGRNLTHASTRFGPGLAGLLQSPPFPAMQAVFATHPLTPQEIADLTAFLARIDSAPEVARSAWAFPTAGTGGAFLLLILVGLTWRARLRGVRRPMIGERG